LKEFLTPTTRFLICSNLSEKRLFAKIEASV
jgi:hypothetical protein